MNAAFRVEEHPASWEWLAETLRPDLVLAQEAIKPDHLAGHGALIGAAGSSYGWGTWVATLNESVDVEPMLQLPLGEYTAPLAVADVPMALCWCCPLGVFERHPTLRFDAVELGAAWFGPMAERMDMIAASSMGKTISRYSPSPRSTSPATSG